jgi:glucosamine--fructose-6-phosphate aminotransferase (isomerizing)
VLINHERLKEHLEQEHGYGFQSDTDSEVILAYLYTRTVRAHANTATSLEQALLRLNQILEGTWAVVVMDARLPDRLYLLRHGSPLIIGVDRKKGETVVASEAHLLGAVEYTYPEDRQVYRATCNGVQRLGQQVDQEPGQASGSGKDKSLGSRSGKNVKNQGAEEHRTVEHYVPLHPPETCPGALDAPVDSPMHACGERYHMLDEIREQPETLKRALNHGGRLRGGQVHLGGLIEYQGKLARIEHVVLLGCGTSQHAAEVGAQWMRRYAHVTTASALDATEFDPGRLPRDVDGFQVLVIAVSQSGETMDLFKTLEAIKDRQYLYAGAVNVVNSLIARTVHCGVYLNAGREVAVASTKSFTSQTLVLGLLAAYLAQIKERSVPNDFLEALLTAPAYLEQQLPRWEEVVRATCQRYQWPSMFVLGKGLGFQVAREGALKIKEVSYLHAEAYPSGALKHGPFALICPTLPVIVIGLRESDATSLGSTVQELRAREARVTVIATHRCLKGSSWPSEVLQIDLGDVDETKAMFGATVILQLVAFYLARARGLNPDYPRNLAKVVTVQ